jgi:hypothetical protein
MEATLHDNISALEKILEKRVLQNQAKTEIYGSIRLYTSQLKAKRSETNQMEATFHDTINGYQKTLKNKSACRIKQKQNSVDQYVHIRIS